MRARSAALAAAVAASFLAATGCSGGPEAPAPATTAVAAREPETCSPCHADEVARWRVSAHRLAARPATDAAQPPRADFAALPGAQGASDAPAGSALTMRAADAAGASEPRAITHVLGGIRREDFLSPRPDGLHVLPLSWSSTRAAWIDPIEEERGVPTDFAGPLGWTRPPRALASACSRCHPAADDAPGVTCSTCHPAAAEHARAAADGGPARAAGSGLGSDAWSGCGPCHAVGRDMPRTKDAPAAGALLDAILPDTLVQADGLNPSFDSNGRPLIAHGREAQSLALSRCFMVGKANCLTCHDPHGGERTSLKQADPDASCRGCHAAIAAEPEAHAKHPVAPPGAVPLARAEPSGPLAAAKGGPVRLPGCVDCHAPAILGFSPADVARDHAIRRPDPPSRRSKPDACSACHPGWGAARLAPALPEAAGSAAAAPSLRDAVKALTPSKLPPARRASAALAAALPLLRDSTLDPWTRASAAAIVGSTSDGRGAAGRDAESLSALESAWTDSADPVLRRAILGAMPAAGATADEIAGLAEAERDWRVRVVAASALGAMKDPRAQDWLESIRRDAALPERAHADAAFELSTILAAAGASTRAEALLLESVAAAPGNSAAWVNLGAVRASQGDAAGAREAWQRALELAPGNAIARANLATLEAEGSAP